MAGKLQNEDFKTEAELTGAGGAKTQLLNDTKVYVTADGINKTLDDAITDGDLGGGGGGSTVHSLYFDGFTSRAGNQIKFKTTQQDTADGIVSVDTSTRTKVTALVDCSINAHTGGTVTSSQVNMYLRIYDSSDTLKVVSRDTTPTAFDAANTSLSYELSAGDYVVAESGFNLTDNQFTMFSVQAIAKTGNVVSETKDILISDVKSSGTDGGTFTSGSWQTRDLNTLSGSGAFCTISSNQITIQPGSYLFKALIPGHKCGRHKGKLRDITNSVDLVIGSSESNFTGAGNFQSSSTVEGIIVIAAVTILEVQHRCITTRATDGLGDNSGFSVDEVYTQVKIEKISE